MPGEKICTKCGLTKPLSEFYKRARGGKKLKLDGKPFYQSWCRACLVHNPYKYYYEKLSADERRKRWREDGKKRRKDNNEVILKKELKRRVFLRVEALRHYATNRMHISCVCCGEDQLLFLSLDHKNNDGNKHRKLVGTGGSNLYAWLKRNNYPAIFQILCHNCNMGRAQNNGVCPHKDGGTEKLALFNKMANAKPYERVAV